MTTLLAETRPVAARPHRCNVCGGNIAVGDRYRRQSLVDGGDMWTYKAHALCDAVYWRLHRDAGLCEDDWVDPDEIVGTLGSLLTAAICLAFTGTPPPTTKEMTAR